MTNNQSIRSDVASLAIALLFIAFWGEPDLIDALIHWLMGGVS